jgi:hypothetical protein
VFVTSDFRMPACYLNWSIVLTTTKAQPGRAGWNWNLAAYSKRQTQPRKVLTWLLFAVCCRITDCSPRLKLATGELRLSGRTAGHREGSSPKPFQLCSRMRAALVRQFALFCLPRCAPLSSLASRQSQPASSMVRQLSWTMCTSQPAQMSGYAPGWTTLANLTRQRCRAVVTTGRACDFYSFIWMNCAPPKVKFFGWLLVQDRIQTKENLLKKHCVDSDVCEVCGERTETSAHRIVGCVFAAGLWRQIGMSLGESDVGCLWDVHPPTYVPA